MPGAVLVQLIGNQIYGDQMGLDPDFHLKAAALSWVSFTVFTSANFATEPAEQSAVEPAREGSPFVPPACFKLFGTTYQSTHNVQGFGCTHKQSNFS